MDSVLDPASTNAARSEGIAGADHLASDTWKTSALEGIRTLCKTRQEITSDDLWELLGEAFMNQVNTSALGPVFVRARKTGLIKRTGRFKDSNRPVTHGKQNRVWETCQETQ